MHGCAAACVNARLVERADGGKPILRPMSWRGNSILAAASLRRCEECAPDGAIKLSQRVRTGSVEERRLPGNSPALRCAIAARAIVLSPHRKRLDYAIALFGNNGDSRAENHRESFETRPDRKRRRNARAAVRTALN